MKYTSKVNTKNLVHIQLGTDHNTSRNVRVGTVNARSVKNKLDIIVETSKIENLDFLVISETWLGEEDSHWLATSSLDTKDYRRRVALLYKDRYQVTRDYNAPQLDLLEYGIWPTRVRNKTLTIVGIYHPPLGSTRNTPVQFLDQVQDLFTNQKNLVLLGDFNIQVNKLDNQDSQLYLDTTKALGLVQHIDQQTHQLGNTLDLVYTESLEPMIYHAFTSSYISDHHLVGIELQMKKQLVSIESSKTRSYKDFNPGDINTSFNNDNILEQDSFEQAVVELEKELTKTLDKLALLQDRRKKKQPSRPWYNATLKEQRRIVRTRE